MVRDQDRWLDLLATVEAVSPDGDFRSWADELLPGVDLAWTTVMLARLLWDEWDHDGCGAERVAEARERALGQSQLPGD